MAVRTCSAAGMRSIEQPMRQAAMRRKRTITLLIISATLNEVSTHETFMKRAIELAAQTALEDMAGGPFGCVIVKDGEIIAEGANRVIADHDPTSHGEINAIRKACKKLGTHDLTGCVLYTSGEPCPMCYAACCWANIDSMFYASTCEDANLYGDFIDSTMFRAMQHPTTERNIQAIELLRDDMLQVWDKFQQLPNRPTY